MKSRRDFMKSVSVGGALIYVSDSWCLCSHSLNTGEQIENEFLTARFDTTSGQIQVERKSATPLLRNAIARAGLADGSRATSDPEYQRSTSVRPYQDALGKGRQLRARCIDRRKQLDFEVMLTLYDGRNALVV